MIPSQRHLFDIPEDIAYFNCAYYSPLLNKSVEKLKEGAESKRYPWNRTADDFFADAETIRELLAKLFGFQPRNYAIMPSASYGFSTAVNILANELMSGDQVLVMDEEFPSLVLPFRRLQTEKGITMVTAKNPENKSWTEMLLNNINQKTKVVAISACHWTNGAFIDIEEIQKACDRHNSVLMIDATQVLGAAHIDLTKINPDFLVVAGYKWMLCPYGFSFMYVNDKWHNGRPLEENWQARENAEDFAGLVNYNDHYKPGACRYDMGEKCIPTILPGAIAALEQILEWGIPSIGQSIAEINMQIEKLLTKFGFETTDKSLRYPHILGASIPKVYNDNVVAELRSKKIFISQRGNSIRFAPHLYNNNGDMDLLNQALFDMK